MSFRLEIFEGGVRALVDSLVSGIDVRWPSHLVPEVWERSLIVQ
jgi:hypothetical protein